jgi:signal transduction histidine kinase
LDKDTLTVYYTELLKSADGQVELLYNLLGWAQLQTRRVVCKPDVFNLCPVVVGNIRKLMTPLLNEKKLAIKFDLPDEMIVFADHNMLMTVVRNLVSNAIKFSYRGGEIQLQAEDAGNFWLLSVRDFGTGMSPEKRDRLFLLDNPSVRGTEGEQGSGLGLIVCKEMIEQNGGTLTVESEEGKGSIFRFTVKKGGR